MFSVSVEKTFHQKVEEVYTGNFVYPELGNPKIYSSEKTWRVQICNTYASQRNCNTFSLLVKFILCIWWLLLCSLIVKIIMRRVIWGYIYKNKTWNSFIFTIMLKTFAKFGGYSLAFIRKRMYSLVNNENY